MAFFFDDQLPEHLRSAAAPCDTLIFEMICKRFGHRYEGHVAAIGHRLAGKTFFAPIGDDPIWKPLADGEAVLTTMRCIGRCQLCGIGIMTDGSK